MGLETRKKVILNEEEFEAFEDTLEDGTEGVTVEIFFPDGMVEGDFATYIIQYGISTHPDTDFYVIMYSQ
jgi:hypothetical protein